MKWDDYKQIYLNYALSVTQTRVVSIISGEILEDFPQNIPNNIRAPVFRKLKEIFETIAEYMELTNSKKKNASLNKNSAHITNENSKEAEPHPYLLDEVFSLLISTKAKEMKFGDIDFRRIQLFQELVMHHSNFEGILADSLRAVCYACPNVMKTEKGITCEEILSCASWNELLDLLVEKLVRDMGWETLDKRLDFFTKHLKLEMQLEENDIPIMKEVELVRNLIVHNGGKVNQKYIELKKSKNLHIGDYIPLDDDYLKLISVTLNMVASELYIEISKKFFGKKEEEILELIWNRRGA